MVKNYTTVQNDVNLDVSSKGFKRKESNEGIENKTDNVYSIICCGDREIIGSTPKSSVIMRTWG